MDDEPELPAGWVAPDDAGVGPAPGVSFARPAARLVAYIIDVAIVTIVSLVLWLVIGTLISIAGMNDAGLLAGIGFFLAFVVWFVFTIAYFPYFWARGGQTPGMKVMKIRVVRDEDGGPVTAGSAVLRLIGYWISQVAFYIGFLWIFVDKRRRGWPDLIAGTCVIEA